MAQARQKDYIRCLSACVTLVRELVETMGLNRANVERLRPLVFPEEGPGVVSMCSLAMMLAGSVTGPPGWSKPPQLSLEWSSRDLKQ